MTLTKKTNVKRYVLKRCSELRPFWGCKRVSAKALDQIETAVEAIVKHFINDYPSIVLGSIGTSIKTGDLLVVTMLRRRLLEGFQNRMKWLTITSISDEALQYVTEDLVQFIDQQIRSHPTIGVTFAP